MSLRAAANLRQRLGRYNESANLPYRDALELRRETKHLVAYVHVDDTAWLGIGKDRDLA